MSISTQHSLTEKELNHLISCDYINLRVIDSLMVIDKV